MPNYTTQVTLDVVVTYAVIPASDGFPEQLDITRSTQLQTQARKQQTSCGSWTSRKSST